MTLPAYATQSEFRSYIKDDTTLDADTIDSVLDDASREVDAYCGRHFYQTTEAQYFTPAPNNLWILSLDDMDLATTDGLVVETEWDNTGTYATTWTLGTDFIAEPVNQSVGGIDGWPYTSLRALKNVWPRRFVDFYRDTVRITGTWGWPAVPEPVKRATLIKAVELYKLADAPFGYVGLNGFGPAKVPMEMSQFTSRLRPYRKASTLLMA